VAERSSSRLLIVAGAAAADVGELPPDVRSLVDEASEILVVTPVLATHVHLWTDDIDGARREADERLNAILGNLDTITSEEQETRGFVGSDVPMTAFEDAVRMFEPDQILIALRSSENAAWQEQGLAQKVKDRFGLPTTVLEIDGAGGVTPV
jgi:hypothetical protein